METTTYYFPFTLLLQFITGIMDGSFEVKFNHMETPILTGWWLGHPSEKYEFVNWDD